MDANHESLAGNPYNRPIIEADTHSTGHAADRASRPNYKELHGVNLLMKGLEQLDTYVEALSSKTACKVGCQVTRQPWTNQELISFSLIGPTRTHVPTLVTTFNYNVANLKLSRYFREQPCSSQMNASSVVNAGSCIHAKLCAALSEALSIAAYALGTLKVPYLATHALDSRQLNMKNEATPISTVEFAAAHELLLDPEQQDTMLLGSKCCSVCTLDRQ